MLSILAHDRMIRYYSSRSLFDSEEGQVGDDQSAAGVVWWICRFGS
jgi:hypothetical protein